MTTRSRILWKWSNCSKDRIPITVLIFKSKKPNQVSPFLDHIGSRSCARHWIWTTTANILIFSMQCFDEHDRVFDLVMHLGFHFIYEISCKTKVSLNSQIKRAPATKQNTTKPSSATSGLCIYSLGLSVCLFLLNMFVGFGYVTNGNHL